MNAFERVLRFDPNHRRGAPIPSVLQEDGANGDRRTTTRARHSHVFQLLDLSRKTGTLRVHSPERNNEGSVYFDAGTIVAATMKSNPHLLGTILERSGKATPADLARATAMQRAGDKRRVGEILVAHGIVTPRDIDRFMRQQIETVVFDLMSWSEGFFSFTEEPPRPIRKDIAVRVSRSLLMEGAPASRWSRIAGRFPDARFPSSLRSMRSRIVPRLLPAMGGASIIDGESNLSRIATTRAPRVGWPRSSTEVEHPDSSRSCPGKG